MNQNNKLIDELKIVLKEKNMTYRAISIQLELSEGTIKRIFSSYDFTLNRLEKICSLVDIELFDLLDNIPAQHNSRNIPDNKFSNRLKHCDSCLGCWRQILRCLRLL